MENNEAKILEMEAVQQREELVTIAGGVHLEVTHLDGTTETVKVRQIPATKVEQFMQKLSDESYSVGVYCAKPPSWVDTLTQESLNEIIEKGLELNQSFLSAWCLRRAKWAEMMNVGVIADLQRKLNTLSEALVSVSSASRLPITTNSDRET